MESANGLADANWRRQMFSVALTQTMPTGVLIEIPGVHPVNAPPQISTGINRRVLAALALSGIAQETVGA